jgi:hypothetical protein
MRRVVISAGLDELPSRVFRKVHVGVDGCRMSHGFLDEFLVILRVEMSAIRGGAFDPSHGRSPSLIEATQPPHAVAPYTSMVD